MRSSHMCHNRENGMLHLTDAPGFGLEPKPGLVREYAVKVVP